MSRFPKTEAEITALALLVTPERLKAALAEDLKQTRHLGSRKPSLGFPRMLIWYGVLPNALMNKKMEPAER